MQQRINLLAMKNGEEDEVGDTFAERAEFYYNKRPQLLALLQELYTAYTTLSDRYIQTIAKHHNHHHNRQSSVTSTLDSFDGADDSGISQIESDAESSLSYQPQQVSIAPTAKNYAVVENDAFIADLVMKNVEYDFLINEVSILEKQCCDSSRKVELQKSLLDVLESERLILLHENASLGYRVGSLIEDNKRMVAEAAFMTRRANEMARCLLRLRDDHRVYLLNQKIEDLQGQIFGLEKRNKEYYEQLVKTDKGMVESRWSNKQQKDGNGNEVTLEACFQIGKLKSKRNSGVNNNSVSDKRSKSGRKIRWWAKVKSMDMFLCGHGTNPT